MPRYDPEITRRKILFAMGLIPASITLGSSKNSWALTSQVNISSDNSYRYIESNGIPDHNTGSFPNRGNPNHISEQKHKFRVKINPQKASKPIKLGMGPFGVAINGVPFEPFAAEFWNRDRNSGWQYEAMTGFINLGLDKNNAHVQPNGSYHYHGIPTGLIKSWSPNSHSPVLGYAADGFPIYGLLGTSNSDGSGPIKELTSSWRLKTGARPKNTSSPGGKYDGRFVEDFEFIKGLGDLDELNGKFTITPDYPEGTYAYFLTTNYPYIPRLFAGEPDPSFIRRPRKGHDSRHKRPKRGETHPPRHKKRF
ncbi:YHYH protein [Curvivirga aplysinae]|uniref:YHYH protein n=1 Tax=Curvivirga aplysinae TaxID=2529852 RepID=UPI0012BBBF54|nr:YHYH protein [Curvivirga aplysinae]MTI09609.1 YHYH protein [Curvivirga aplysinae]